MMKNAIVLALFALVSGLVMAQQPVVRYTGPRDFVLMEQSSPELLKTINPTNATDPVNGGPGVGAYDSYSAGLYLPAVNISTDRLGPNPRLGQLVGKSAGPFFPKGGNVTDGTPAGTLAITGCTGPFFGLTGTDVQEAISDFSFGHRIHLEG
ncbi:hypothetical protein WJX72_000699 [[Myrmecia] bisecta]|uniref:Uncharacterized protein n=1 Tax=[Myrmecia] bisecta TaxID=41462 RepID=A0AAW1P525_9CHLO